MLLSFLSSYFWNLKQQEEEEEDGVLSELHRCQEELQVLAQENERQLNSMIKLLQDEMVRQELRKKLKHQDAEVECQYYIYDCLLLLTS